MKRIFSAFKSINRKRQPKSRLEKHPQTCTFTRCFIVRRILLSLVDQADKEVDKENHIQNKDSSVKITLSRLSRFNFILTNLAIPIVLSYDFLKSGFFKVDRKDTLFSRKRLLIIFKDT